MKLTTFKKTCVYKVRMPLDRHTHIDLIKRLNTPIPTLFTPLPPPPLKATKKVLKKKKKTKKPQKK